MRIWTKTTLVPALAAVAVVFLTGAGVSGIDEMASLRLHYATHSTLTTPTTNAQPSLHDLLMDGLAKGSLPGGFPYDEPRNESIDEQYQEALNQQRPSSSPTDGNRT
ncbi:hypothetical protein [Sinomonas susongensis]|uniref:hypothetical protein n=1 Tax=Sinomonas susongensis TaxID=1324851 RepID=UPI0011099227|nr:hypothetical protein [Sinomonas susongensis]